MRFRSIAMDVAVMVIVCIAAMFLHPIIHGPYSAVHGPTTALRAHYRALAIFTSMALAAFSVAAQLAAGTNFVGYTAAGLARCVAQDLA